MKKRFIELRQLVQRGGWSESLRLTMPSFYAVLETWGNKQDWIYVLSVECDLREDVELDSVERFNVVSVYRTYAGEAVDQAAAASLDGFVEVIMRNGQTFTKFDRVLGRVRAQWELQVRKQNQEVEKGGI